MRLVAIGLALLLLAGCWESNTLLLDPQQAVYPFPEGSYYSGNDQSAPPTKVSYAENGWYRIDEDMVLINRLGVGSNGLPSYAYAGRTGTDGVYVYGVLLVGNGGNVVYKLQPNCDSEYDQKIFERAGNGVNRLKDGVTSCYFSSRASALSALMAVSQDFSYTRIAVRYERR